MCTWTAWRGLLRLWRDWSRLTMWKTSMCHCAWCVGILAESSAGQTSPQDLGRPFCAASPVRLRAHFPVFQHIEVEEDKREKSMF